MATNIRLGPKILDLDSVWLLAPYLRSGQYVNLTVWINKGINCSLNAHGGAGNINERRTFATNTAIQCTQSELN